MTISLKADAGGTFGEILVNGTQVAKFTPGGNAVLAGLVGTVSESGGTPTGAVIEQGSNANGRFVRFADGTQICTRIFNPNLALTSGSFTTGATVSFAATFSSDIRVFLQKNGYSNNASTFVEVSAENILTTSFVPVFITNTSHTYNANVFMVAIGRWF